MWRGVVGFEVIPRRLYGEKDPIAPYCSREH
jgi:hypothetical protein